MGKKSRSITRHTILIVLTFSVVFALLSAAFFFAIEYRSRTAAITEEIEIIWEAQMSGLIEGIWNYDYELIFALLDGIIFHPFVSYAAVEEMTGGVFVRGVQSADSVSHRYPLMRTLSDGHEEELGILYIGIDNERILSDVTGEILRLLFFFAVFLIFESLVLLLFFSRTVTMHLTRIADYMRRFGVQPDAPTLVLEKRDRGDEIDILVGSFNRMREDLVTSRQAEKRAIEDLKASEEMNRVLIEEAPDAIMIYDADAHHFISANRRAETLFGMSVAELVTVKPANLFIPDPEKELSLEQDISGCTERALAGESVLTRRFVRRPHGEVTICEVRLNCIPSANRNIVRVSYLDITDRIRAEEELRRSLREKEVLLQEVYHRTKNNMQVIASLLNIEAMSCGNEKVCTILNEMNGRITAMSLVHQKLYESKDLSRIDFGEYLEDLLAEIKPAYFEKARDVEMGVSAERGIVVLIDTAIPCGLVINELIVNAIKYAFPDNRKGNIRVKLERDEAGFLVLTVADDGVGLPPGFDFRSDGKIGLQTVVSLIEAQLQGDISFISRSGTVCTMKIRDNLYTARV